MKKRIVTIALVVALLATCFAGTYAYLTDSKVQVNTFTTGKVYITLDEAEVVKDEETGDLVQDGTNRTTANQTYEKLVPGMTIDKDPTITLNAGSEDAWIAAKVTLEKYDFYTSGLLFGGVLYVEPVDEGALPYVVVPDEQNGADGNDTYIYYVYVTKPMVAGKSIALFEKLWIPDSWGNEMMELIDDAKISVEAYGVQANVYATCQEAMYGVYDEVFPEPPTADEND